MRLVVSRFILPASRHSRVLRTIMQDPNEDTEWNAILREKGILPKKEVEITEDDLIAMLDEAALKRLAGEVVYEDKTLEELDEFEDDEDEEVLAEYRRKRIEEMKAEAAKKQFGEVINITANEYKAEINEAGEGIWVVLHLYQDHNLICRRLKQIWAALAKKFPLVKFVQSVSTLCIPNFPDRNLPAVFIYYEDDLKKQWIGPAPFGGEKVSEDDVEWMLSNLGAVKTDLEEDPRMKRVVKQFMEVDKTIRSSAHHRDSDSEDDD